MTVGTTPSRVRYAGDGATVDFPVPFAFIAAGDLQVVERAAADGAETPLALGADYTVSGGGGAAGTVHAAAAPSASVEWVIRRTTARAQDVDYTANDPFPAETHERAIDRLTMIAQEQDEALARVPTLPVSAALAGLALPEPAAGRLLGWNAAGDGLANLAAADLALAPVTPFAAGLLDDADAAEARATLGLGGAAVAGVAAGGSAGLLRADGDGSGLTGIAVVEPTGGNVLAPHERLVVRRASAATVDIDAAALLLKAAGGAAVRVEAVDLTVDITAAGANGLDAGSEATATWYHLWAIWNGAAAAGLLSTSSTSPTLPAGYTHKGYVGAVYNNASGNFVDFFQRGECVGSSDGDAALTDGSAASFSAVSLAAFVPPTAVSAQFLILVNTSTGTANAYIEVAPDGSSTAPQFGRSAAQRLGASVSGEFAYTSCELTLSTPQQIKYYVSGASARGRIRVSGWKY